MLASSGDDTARASRAERLFMRLTARPLLFLVLGLAGIIAMAAGLPRLAKDTSADAFIAADDPAVVYRDRMRALFGLDDPFVIAVSTEARDGVYAPAVLELVDTLTRAVQGLDNIDPDRVRSLATESNIVGTADGMAVNRFFELGDSGRPDGAAIRAAIEDFPLYQGAMVARDGSGTLIIAEVINDDRAQQTYDALLALVDSTAAPAGVTVHVAGEAAVSGYLGTYIDRDAQRLNPLAALTITLVLILAFRTATGAIVPNLIVAATAAGALGLMAFAGVPFYVITNGLLPILIGIAVADSIHILSEYYELAAMQPEASRRQHIARAMARMWRPVSLTTLTTVAGFVGLWWGAEMPPMRAFGQFAAIGVVIAWVYSMLFLPAVIALVPIRPSPAFARDRRSDVISVALTRFGGFVLGRPRAVVASIAVVLVLGAVGASRLVIEESQIENFQHDEPVYLADTAINAHFDGVNYLDLVVEAAQREALFEPAALRRIEALQAFGETLPGVQGSTSVVDYIKQMHRAVMENSADAYALPEDPLLIAQLFLLYSTTGDPTDFEEEIDYDYQRANVRFSLNSSLYSNNRQVIAALQEYIQREFTGTDLEVNLTGRVFVNNQWLQTIADNHFRSLAISLVLVWLMAALVFRSALAGAFALIPVIMSILVIYAVMGFGGIWLGVGTSMFAAIAIGLGIDFAIHTLDRMRELARTGTGSLPERLAPLFPGTGRALFFNFAAIGLGFVLLTSSEVPPLVKFGALVAVAVTAAFIASLALMPALTVLLRPRFIVPRAPAADATAGLAGSGIRPLALLAAVTLATLMPAGRGAIAADPDPGVAIMQAVVDRDEGEWVTRRLTMSMTDRNGTVRERETVGYRRFFGAEKRTVLFYTAPANVKDTAFLTYDYPEADRDDDQWLYLPALRKVRRISASDRGDYFLGTDLTYEDIKKENKIAMEDYRLQAAGSDTVEGVAVAVVEGLPVDERVAGELGYGRVHWYVDTAIAVSRRTESWDTAGNRLKTIHARDITLIDGIVTVMTIEVENHKTGHATRFSFKDIDYRTEVPEQVFRTSALKRGAR